MPLRKDIIVFEEKKMKKRLTLITAIFILFVSTVYADGDPKVVLSGFYEAHNKVKVKTENIDDIKQIDWYVDEIAVAQGNEYIISDYDSGCEIKAIVTDEQGNKYESNIKKINDILKKKEDSFSFSNDGDKASYEFKIDGTEFLLLNATEDDKSTFFVVKKEPIEARVFNKNTKSVAGNNPQHFYDMSAFLNNTSMGYGYLMDDELEERETAENYTESGYKGNDNYTQIPNSIFEHIDREHVWKCEPAKIGQAYEYCVKAGIVLPSTTDVRKYPFAFYGISNAWLRTPRGTNLGNEREVMFLDGDKVSYAEYSEEKNLMLEFYLDREFFLKNKLTSAGAEVLKILTETYDYNELLSLYTEKELDNLGYKKYILKSAQADNMGSININLQSTEKEPVELYVMVLAYDEKDMLMGASCEKITPVCGDNEITATQNGEYSKIMVMLTNDKLVPMAQSLTVTK